MKVNESMFLWDYSSQFLFFGNRLNSIRHASAAAVHFAPCDEEGGSDSELSSLEGGQKGSFSRATTAADDKGKMEHELKPENIFNTKAQIIPSIPFMCLAVQLPPQSK